MCAICARAAGPVHPLYENERQLVILPRYVRRWGQVMVIPKAHATTYAEIGEAAWSEASTLALRAARAAESILAPRRCYLASTGSAAGELTQSSTHLHIHVIPLYDPDDRPADVFSWASGVYVAENAEWEALRVRFAEAIRSA
jgi:diadenosine tetraphosphate (Ap4A) HIT family hydrolase